MPKCKIKNIAFALFIFLLLGSVPAFGYETNKNKTVDGIKATVIEVLGANQKEVRGETSCIEEQKVKVVINTGKHKGENFVILNSIDTSFMKEEYLLSKGDEVLISLEEQGGKVISGYTYEFAKDKYLLYIVVIFVALMILIGGTKGIRTLFSLCITGAIILKLFPMLLLKGYNPIQASIVISICIIIITLLIMNGGGRKTISAIIGTSCGVGVGGGLAIAVGQLARITGRSLEAGQMFVYIPENIKFDYKGLLFSAILMGSLGAIMNISMSITSAMDEINEINPEIGFIALIKQGMHVGKGIIGNMCNTLFLAYIGAALPSLILLFIYKTSFVDIINQSIVATEILRIVCGCIGLVICIPITVLMYGILRKRVTDRKFNSLIKNFENID